MSQWNLYDSFREHQFTADQFDLEDTVTYTFKVAIVTNSYTPDQNAQDYWDDVSANEVSGTGYTAGGNAAANPSVTMDAAGLVTFDADDPAQWTQDAAGFTDGRRFILYADSGTPSTSPLIAYSDAEAADFGNVDGPVSVQFDADGIFESPRQAA